MGISKDNKQKIIDEIFNRIIEGENLRAIFKSKKISVVTFFKWIDESETLAKQYARIMTLRAQMMFEDIIDEAEKEPALIENKFGVCVDIGDVQNKKLIIDTKKWAASKMLPKKYGDNLEFYEKLKIDQEKEQQGDNKIIIERV